MPLTTWMPNFWRTSSTRFCSRFWYVGRRVARRRGVDRQRLVGQADVRRERRELAGDDARPGTAAAARPRWPLRGVGREQAGRDEHDAVVGDRRRPRRSPRRRRSACPTRTRPRTAIRSRPSFSVRSRWAARRRATTSDADAGDEQDVDRLVLERRQARRRCPTEETLGRRSRRRDVCAGSTVSKPVSAFEALPDRHERRARERRLDSADGRAGRTPP